MGILKGKYSKGRTKKVSSSNRQAELLSCCWQEEPAEMTHSFDHIKLSGRGLDFTGQLPCISILIRRQLDWGSWARECFLFLWMFTSFYLFFKKKKIEFFQIDMSRKCRNPDGAGKVSEMKIMLQMLIVPPTPTCPKTLTAPYTT